MAFMAALAPPSPPAQNKLPSLSSKTPVRMPTILILLQMCSNFQEVRQVHAQLVVSGLLDRPSNSGRVLQSYVKVSQISYASSVFDRISHHPDVFAYNNMMRGFMLVKCPYNSLLLYNKLLLDGLRPDNYTYTFVLKACSQLNAIFEGRQVHCRIVKAGIGPDTHVHSSLIHMYSSSNHSLVCAERVLAGFSEENTLAKNSLISGYLSWGQVEKARAMFDNMAAKDDASWSAMVAGYTKIGMFSEALTLFRKMIISQVLPNESALVSSLSACAHLGALDQGRWIHAYVDKIGAKISVTLGTALIDMYAKCGSIANGYEIFRKLPQKDVVSWGVIISGFAIHGEAEKCFELLDEMVATGTYPNEVIFVAILSACSHAGYVEIGYEYLDQMVREYGIRPSIEHYGCMVDLLGRAGRLEEAEELIMSLPENANSVIWGALLGASRKHGDLRRGSLAFKHLTELEPMSGDRYKLAGLMFSKVGEKENATKIRRLIRENDLETTKGLSFIEIDGAIHEFEAGTINHSKHKEIYDMWKSVHRLLHMDEYHEFEVGTPL